MQDILVYQDYVHNNGVLLGRLRDTFGAERVTHCDAQDILNDQLNAASLFVMPGGADLFFCEKLNGAANTKIRKYVESGGTYLGICAGAYYACRRIEWAKDKDDAIIQTRELGFFPGTAIGPLPEIMESFEGSWAGVAHLDAGPAFYRGGCWFRADGDGAFTTLASYSDGRPAIVSMDIGQGRVILTGCHLEHRPDDLVAETYRHRNASQDYLANVTREFADAWSPDTDLWTRFISPLSK